MMRAAPRGLAIVAWSNGIVGMVGTWECLTAASSHEVPQLSFLAVTLRSVLQVVAGQHLLEYREWARRYLLFCAGATLVCSGPALSATSRALSHGGVGLWFIVTIVVPLLTLWFLRRPDVAESFPPLPRGERFAVDACAALLLYWVANVLSPVPPQPEQVAAARPNQKLPSYSSAPIAPGTGPVTLLPTYDGKPVRDFTTADVRLTLTAIEEKPFYDPQGVKRSYSVNSVGTIERPWRVRHGRIRIASVPAGLYQVALAIDRNRDNGPGDVGDLGSGGTRVELRTGHGPVREVVPLQTRFVLREPETAPDRSGKPDMPPAFTIVGGWRADDFDRLPRVSSPVRFAWDPVPGALRYQVSLACHAFERPVQKLVSTPSWTTDLEQCPPPHPWRVWVSAMGSAAGPALASTGAGAFVVAGTASSRRTNGLGPATLTLRPTFDGRALRHIDERDVSLALLPPGRLEAVRPAVRVRHGRIKIPRLAPDYYSLWLVIGPDARGRGGYQTAGDFVANGDRPMRQLRTEWQPENRVVEVQRTMQLVEPEPPAWCGYIPTHVQSPVDLRWEPVPDAVEYTLQMTGTRDARADVERFVVREPSWRGTLPSTGPTGGYNVKIAARTAKGTDIAQLQYHLVVD
jgi:hypothetical protein